MVRPLAVLVVLGSVVAASPRVVVPRLPTLERMTRAAAADEAPLAARCFAYSTASHAFACLGHDPIFNSDHFDGVDQATNVRIDLLGPAQQAAWTIAAIGGRPTRSRAAVEGALDALGLRPLATAPIRVPPNHWVAVGAVQLFLRVNLHEGDASIENFGELTVRCAKAEVAFDLRRAGIELGETAVAYRSPDGDWLALTVSGLDGGEDLFAYSLDTAVLDLATTCAQQRPAMWTRSQGPEDP